MTIHSSLKLATHSLHRKIEKNPLIKKLTSKQIQLSEYILLLKKFYGFIAPCEAIITRQPESGRIISTRNKTPLLYNDLITLGLTSKEVSQIPVCQNLPELLNRGNVLGYLYVIEGSTLGGQIITRFIQDNLSLTPEVGIRYFHGYGKETRWKWQTFCDTLDMIDENSSVKTDAITTAIATFNLLNQWLGSH